MVGTSPFSSSGVHDGKLSYILRSPEKSHRFGVTALALSRNGSSIFTAGRDGTVREWESVPTRSADCKRQHRIAEGATKTFDEHVDWVNDLVLMKGDERLLTCSSDTTIKVWNTARPEKSLRTLAEHSDYVKALTCVPSNRVASASLDGRVIVWDLVTGRNHMTCGDTERTPAPSSIYCLSGSTDAQTVVAGSTDRSISVYDLRTGERVVRLRGHSDSIRCVCLKHDGTQMLSGSTDTTVKLWDLRQERCIQSYDSYTSDSIWALAADRNFDRFLSGGRDGSVWQFCLRNHSGDNVVEQSGSIGRFNMVLDLAMTEDKSAVWVSTTGSSVRLWSLPPLSRSAGMNGVHDGKNSVSGTHSVSHRTPADPAVVRKPLYELKGLAGIISYKIMNDRRHVLTCDTSKEYCIWDITRGKFVKSLGVLGNGEENDIEEVAKKNDHEVSVPSWFTVDIRLGSLSVHFSRKTVFSAEIYAVDAGLQTENEEAKVNIGEHAIRGLFSKWSKNYRMDETDDEHLSGNKEGTSDDQGSETRTLSNRSRNLPPYEFPSHITVMVTDPSTSMPALLKRVGSFDGSEDSQIPTWVIDLVRDNRTPPRSAEKMAFSLHPAEESKLFPLQTTALNAPKVLRIRKVASYICDHLPGDCEVDEGDIEILCNGQVVPPRMSLATVSHFRWKGPEDLKLQYRRKKDS